MYVLSKPDQNELKHEGSKNQQTSEGSQLIEITFDALCMLGKLIHSIHVKSQLIVCRSVIIIAIVVIANKSITNQLNVYRKCAINL